MHDESRSLLGRELAFCLDRHMLSMHGLALFLLVGCASPFDCAVVAVFSIYFMVGLTPPNLIIANSALIRMIVM